MAIPNPNLIYRTDLTGSLTFTQLDGNFAYLSQSIADITFVESSSHADNATNANNALTASYIAAVNVNGQVANAATASYIAAVNVNGQVANAANADNAATASYVDATNVDGQVANAANADNAATASYVDATNVDGQVANATNADNALTASYIDASNVDGTVANAANAVTASYVSAANVDGQVTAAINADNALTASYVPTLNQDVTISGSILISGSLIPNTDGVSSTSSFDLGSPTAAWKDIYVSNGTINFLDAGGNVVQTMGTGNNSLEGDTTVNGNLYLNATLPTNGVFVHGSNTATGESSHAQGLNSLADGPWSHAEGGDGVSQQQASGKGSHAEGAGTVSSGIVSHAEGYRTLSSGSGSHAEGADTITLGYASHAEGRFTLASGYGSHAEGSYTTSSGRYSHAEGSSSIAAGTGSHAEGLGTIAVANYQHTLGRFNITSSDADTLFIIGNGSANNNRNNVFVVDIYGSTLEGNSKVSGSLFVNAPGQLNQVIQGPNHSIGGFPGAIGVHIQGITNQVGANASYSHVEGAGNAIEGYACHAEGEDNYIGFGVLGAHAEGFQNKIYGSTFHNKYAHYAHVEGTNTTASGSYSHAEGAGTITLGTASHAEGLETIAKGNFQHVQGQYNATSSVDSAFIVGNGFDNDNRSNLIFAAEETVSINNILKLTVRTTNPITPVEGSIIASGSAGASKLYYYNGTAWIDLTA